MQKWVDGDDNYGVILQAEDEGIIGISPRFVTDEGPADERPYLDVDCY